jgi:hypothetical protein
MMSKKVAVAVVALLAGALMLPNHQALARDGGFAGGAGAGVGGGSFRGGGSGDAICSVRRAGMTDWINLHRPDGEVVHIKADHIVFVMSATGTGADKRALSKVQLVNGFSDVRESVEEVMRAIQNDDSDQISSRAVGG